MKLQPTKTPDRLNASILDGWGRLVPGVRLIFVSRRPSPDAVVNKCTFHVRQYLTKHAGEMVFGWEISIREGVLLEAVAGAAK
jgi:hypothetical protein